MSSMTLTFALARSNSAMLGDDGQVLFDGVLYPSRNNYPAKSIACTWADTCCVCV